MIRRSDFDRALGSRVRWVREYGGMTQAQLAMRAGITDKVLSRIERGERSLLAAEVGPLCTATGLTPLQLLGSEPITVTRSVA